MKKILLMIICSYFLFFFLIPPFQTPDEPEHLESVFWVSRGLYPYRPLNKEMAFSTKFMVEKLTREYDSGDVIKPFVLPAFERIKNSGLRNKYEFTNQELQSFDKRSSQSYHPPLFYLIASQFYRLGDFLHLNLIQHIYMVRLASAMLFFGSLLFISKIFLRLFPDKKIAYGLLIFWGMNPFLLANSVGINPDNMITFSSALFFYLFLRFSKNIFSYPYLILFGIVTGIATVSKFSGIVSFGFFGLLILLQYRFSIDLIKKSLVYGGSWFAITLPWFMLNMSRYKTPIIENFSIVPQKPIVPVPFFEAVFQALFEFRHTFMHYSGFIGWSETYPFKILFISYSLSLIPLVIIGLVQFFKQKNIYFKYLGGYVILFLIFCYLLGLNFKIIGLSWDIQGRYILPIFFSIPVLIFFATSSFFKNRNYLISRIMSIFAVTQYYFILFFVLIPKYYV